VRFSHDHQVLLGSSYSLTLSSYCLPHHLFVESNDDSELFRNFDYLYANDGFDCFELAEDLVDILKFNWVSLKVGRGRI
jgi:hypothetical protein